MSMRRIVAAPVLAFVFAAGTALAQDSGLGKPLTESDIKQWDITVLPDGSNLPSGSGMPAQGAKIFAEKCSACHGEAGKGRAVFSGTRWWTTAHQRHRHGEDDR